MSKKLPKRYVSEKAVKRALKIDSFREMSKDKIIQFASMIPYVDKDVAMAIINQFPVFADFAKIAISAYQQEFDNILKMNNDSYKEAVKSYQTILDALSIKMNEGNISEEERKSITEDMILVADKIAEINLQNQKFLDKMATKAVFGLVFVVALIGAAIGINTKMGCKDDLPELEDEDIDDEDIDDN
ncbi:MAG: hypothetical protein ACI4HK_04120 [Ruminococcus sp.]